MLVMFKTGTLRFFDSPPCASGATVDALLTASRRQLACLHLFSQCLGNIVGFANSVSI
jgi:hypothetical protein